GRGEGGRARAKDDRDDPAEGPPVHVASARKRIRGERRQNAAMPGEEARRAHGRWELQLPGRAPLSGEGDLEVTDDAVFAGGVSVEHLDADGLRDADRVLALEFFPEGRLTISLLGRRHETFAAALAEARDRARLA